jgi:hypothetical protein
MVFFSSHESFLDYTAAFTRPRDIGWSQRDFTLLSAQHLIKEDTQIASLCNTATLGLTALTVRARLTLKSFSARLLHLGPNRQPMLNAIANTGHEFYHYASNCPNGI